jgi:protein-S-isoprenylcysteine O-methyltransferase Ste14
MLSIGAHQLSFASGLLYIIDDIALLYLVLLLWIPFFWLVFHPAIRFWRRVGHRAFWLALPVWLIFAIGTIAARHELLGRRVDRNALTWAVGGVLFSLASWLDVQTRHAFGWRRIVGVPELNPGHRLSGVIRTGIYGRVRHPRYVLYMLMVLSMAFLTGAQMIFLLAFLNILLYQILAPFEERALVDQYGPLYEDYRRSVPRFVPHLRWTSVAPILY